MAYEKFFTYIEPKTKREHELVNAIKTLEKKPEDYVNHKAFNLDYANVPLTYNHLYRLNVALPHSYKNFFEFGHDIPLDLMEVRFGSYGKHVDRNLKYFMDLNKTHLVNKNLYLTARDEADFLRKLGNFDLKKTILEDLNYQFQSEEIGTFLEHIGNRNIRTTNMFSGALSNVYRMVTHPKKYFSEVLYTTIPTNFEIYYYDKPRVLKKPVYEKKRAYLSYLDKRIPPLRSYERLKNFVRKRDKKDLKHLAALQRNRMGEILFRDLAYAKNPLDVLYDRKNSNFIKHH